MTPPSKTQGDVDRLVVWMSERLPSFAIRYKDESRLQRLIGWLLWPINRVYLSQYTTVMFGKVYFPSRSVVEAWGPETVYRILRHEFVHLMDAKRFPLLFEVSYLFCLPALFTFRAFWEVRGYTQDLLLEFETRGTISEQTLARIHQRMTGPEYGWMWVHKPSAQRWLKRIARQIESGELRGPYPYQTWGQSPPPN